MGALRSTSASTSWTTSRTPRTRSLSTLTRTAARRTRFTTASATLARRTPSRSARTTRRRTRTTASAAGTRSRCWAASATLTHTHTDLRGPGRGLVGGRRLPRARGRCVGLARSWPGAECGAVPRLLRPAGGDGTRLYGRRPGWRQRHRHDAEDDDSGGGPSVVASQSSGGGRAW